MRAALLLSLGLSAAAAAHAAPLTYRLDPEHTWVTFEVRHFGTSTLRGSFGPVSGAVQLDREGSGSYVGLTIATATVSTGVKLLDRRLCEADLLACTGDGAVAYFVARQFRFSGPALAEVRGEFTWRGVSQPLSLQAEHFGCHTHPRLKREVCGGDFQAMLQRSAFGASFGLPFVADEVRLKIAVEGVRD